MSIFSKHCVSGLYRAKHHNNTLGKEHLYRQVKWNSAASGSFVQAKFVLSRKPVYAVQYIPSCLNFSSDRIGSYLALIVDTTVSKWLDTALFNIWFKSPNIDICHFRAETTPMHEDRWRNMYGSRACIVN